MHLRPRRRALLRASAPPTCAGTSGTHPSGRWKPRLHPLAVLAFICLGALLLASCGSDNSTITATGAVGDSVDASSEDAPSDSHDHDDDHHSGDGDHGGDHGGHHHGEVRDVPDGMPTPTVALDVSADPGGGHTVSVTTTDFTIAPRNASGPSVDGEGHLHLYVDGERWYRFYNEALHLTLEPGEHEVMVELSANDHAAWAVGGEPIRAMATVTADGRGTGHDHGHGSDEDGGDDEMAADDMADDTAGDMHDGMATGDGEVDWSPVPTVSVMVTEDPKSGWNVHAPITNFTLSAERVSGEAVDGEGHMHLYVNGTKITRMYGEWWHVSSMPGGDNEIMVELVGNDHTPLMLDGEPLTATTTVTVDAPTMADVSAAPADAIAVTYAGGDVTTDDSRVTVDRGDDVTLAVASDVDEEVHVHGYDLHADVVAGELSQYTFAADIPGIFEIEFEGSGDFIVELEVR